MRSGRHGAARPPIGVLIQLDRVNFLLFTAQFVLAGAMMVLSGPTSVVFWCAAIVAIVSVTLAVRRVDQLSRAELRDDELL